jgi:hypothetical protein
MTIHLPEDYETCGDCGFDHDYEYFQANAWHSSHPGSYGCDDGVGPGAHAAYDGEDAYFEALKETPE